MRSISAASFPLGHLHDQGVILPQLQCEGLSQSFLSSAKSKKLNISGSVEPSKPLSSMDTETSRMIFSDGPGALLKTLLVDILAIIRRALQFRPLS